MVLDPSAGKKFLIDLEAVLRRELLRTWKEQGHYMSGSIVETADFVIKQTVEKLSFLMYIFPYGGYIETGVAASNIPFSKPTGRGGSSRYIQALILYAKKRMNLPDAQAKSAAFAIAMKQKREGMPTGESKKYSSSGTRTGWISETIDKNKAVIEAAMYNAVGEILSIQFENMIEKNQQLFKS